MGDRPSLITGLINAYNLFSGKEDTYGFDPDQSHIYYNNYSSYRGGKGYSLGITNNNIITAIKNRIAIDVSSHSIQHVILDKNGRFQTVKDSKLNDCLTIEANIDQTGRNLIHDFVYSILDEGVAALVPIEVIGPSQKLKESRGKFDIVNMRVGRILEWYPYKVKIEVYNELTGNREQQIVWKHNVAIVENPLYEVMNQENSTLQRLLRKLTLLDAIDQQSGSGKLDLIIQLPYVIKSQTRKDQAEARRKDIEDQLSGSKYGIAYTDGTERITQLNRPVENNLMKQIEYLTSMLYNQLGLSNEIFNGTADETMQLHYFNTGIEPFLSAIVGELKRKFLTTTARTQGQTIKYFRDPFKSIPMLQLASTADTFTRNEILSSNEVRDIIGFKPSSDPRADELRNKNLNPSNQQEKINEINQDKEEVQNGI